MKKLSLGIIGMSDGNGHPYSWAAIFNGYNKKVMKNCPFPVIPEYLAKRKFPEDSIKSACVTHIWTQDKKISRHIAQAANIANIVDDYRELIGKVDAILLARDDAERHFEMSAPFLKAGLPVYIDKPLATSIRMAEKIFGLQKYDGQIFSCSALRYAKEFCLKSEDRKNIGTIEYVDACIANSWNKYAIHIIEPVLQILGEKRKIRNIKSIGCRDRKIVMIDWEDGIQTTFSTLGKAQCPTVIRVFGNKGFKEMFFSDTFSAFKASLKAFVDTVINRKEKLSKKLLFKAVEIIERGNNGDV